MATRPLEGTIFYLTNAGSVALGHALIFGEAAGQRWGSTSLGADANVGCPLKCPSPLLFPLPAWSGSESRVSWDRMVVRAVKALRTGLAVIWLITG